MQSILNIFSTTNRKSTAEVFSQKLKKTGVQSHEISSEHMKGFYSSLNDISSSPDFTSTDKILERLVDANEFSSGPEQINLPLLGVIVETRKHPSLELVVNNFAENIKAPIQIFHGCNNLDYIMATSISDLVRSGEVHLSQLNTDALNASSYNALLLSKRFWRLMNGRGKILVFQTDAITCSDSDFSISDFFTYDYIGSKWKRKRPVGAIIDGGNGGLSLRTWKNAYECLNRFSPSLWSAGEDGYFAFHVELIGGKVGKCDACARFSTQDEFLSRSWGAHKISELKPNDKVSFLNYCPVADFLL